MKAYLNKTELHEHYLIRERERELHEHFQIYEKKSVTSTIPYLQQREYEHFGHITISEFVNCIENRKECYAES